jgi:hypothetical protein
MISCGGGDFDDFLDAFFLGLRSFGTVISKFIRRWLNAIY